MNSPHPYQPQTQNKLSPLLHHIVILAFMALGLSACGGGNESALSETETSVSTQSENQSSPLQEGLISDSGQESAFKGRVVKGIISNAMINAYPIVELNGNYVIDPNAKPITTRTNGSGYYQVKPGKGRHDNYYYLEMRTDQQTSMICDLHTGCVSKQSGDWVAFGESFPLAEGFVLSNIVKSKAGKISHAPMTPLTHLAVKYLMTLPGGASPENIAIAETYIETLFGLADRALALLPSDLTALTELKRLKQEELKLGVLSAAFAPYIETANWDDIGALPLDDIFLLATNLAQFLKTQVSSGQHISTLSSVEADTLTQYESLAIAPPSIVEQPRSLVIREGEQAYFDVVAQGGDPLSYQWQKGGSILPGETTSRLSFNPAHLNDEGVYSVTISNEAGSLRSDFASLTISDSIEPITISQQPISAMSIEGKSATFSVSASGGGFISYQWRKDGIAIPNAYEPVYTIEATSLADAGSYDVVLSNSVGSVTSASASLNVILDIAAVTITQQPKSISINEGENGFLTISASGGGNVSYQWFKDGSPLPNANSQTLQINAASTWDQGVYHVNVSNEVSSLNSLSALIAVTATAPQPVSMSLNWTIPEERLDGSVLALQDIYGYAIIFGTELEALAQSVEVRGAESVSTSLTLLPATYYFKIATIEINGQQGLYSDPIQVVLE